MTRAELRTEASYNYIKLLNSEATFDYEDMECAFKKGAMWADEHPINVWHDTSKEPKWNEPMLGEDSEGFNIYKWVGQEDCWFTFVDVFGLNRWAYIKDLLPKEEK